MCTYRIREAIHIGSFQTKSNIIHEVSFYILHQMLTLLTFLCVFFFACAFVHIFLGMRFFKESDNKFGGRIIYCLFYFIALEDREEINQVRNKEI